MLLTARFMTTHAIVAVGAWATACGNAHQQPRTTPPIADARAFTSIDSSRAAKDAEQTSGSPDQEDGSAARDVGLVSPDLAPRTDVGAGDSRAPAGDGPLPDTSSAGQDAGPLQALAGFRLEVPCLSTGFVTQELCSEKPVVTATARIGGASTTTYDVTLRVRGLVEPRLFKDTGGRPLSTMTQAPYWVDGSLASPDVANKNYGFYRLDVSQPKATYYLNAFHSIAGKFHHHLFPIDYTAQIKVRGESVVTLTYSDGNSEQVANFTKQVVPGIAPAPNPFNGQFVQLDVVSGRP